MFIDEEMAGCIIICLVLVELLSDYVYNIRYE